jgi:hypothetical protein
MTPRNSTLAWLLVFVALNLYVNLLSSVVSQSPVTWFAYAIGFFVLAWLAGRWALGVRNLAGFGLGLAPGWGRQLGVGFALGASVWALKNVVFLGMGKFDVVGLMDGGFIATLMAQALLGMLLSSAINDLMIRGYWYAWCTRTDRLRWYLLLASVLYALDDAWNAGFAPLDLAFSLVLGVALAWTVLKTGRIWMAIGIHWGGNMVFRAMSGFDGQGAIRIAEVRQGTRYEIVAIAVTALLIPAVYWLLPKAPGRSSEPGRAIG